MGRRLVALAAENPGLSLVAALEATGHPQLGADAGELAGVGTLELPISAELTAQPAAMIDFSGPEGMRQALEICTQKGIALVIGTTGYTAADDRAIDQAAGSVAVLQAPNMSPGVNLLFALAGQVAARLGQDYDIEIVEGHHRFKKDAPSGTALGIARSICDATDRDPDSAIQHGRQGQQPRQPGEIGMHALRMGEETGRHSVHFGTFGEELTLAHKASTRDVFVRGALRAADWLAGREPGRYSMNDVLGLS
jgi:4-hydroxy-tetrahydrodipicolinate reductase